MNSYQNNKYFLIVPRASKNFIKNNTQNESYSLEELSSEINNKESQANGLQKIGITFNGRYLCLDFKESGYSSANDGSNNFDNLDQDGFTTKLPMEDGEMKETLKVQVILTPFIQNEVCNFLGYISIEIQDGRNRIIPLVGEGTVAIEGKEKDRQQSFLTDLSFASFQQKVAIICAVAKTSGVREGSFELLQDRFRQINEKYYGRGDLLEYTFLCVNCDNVETYLEYTKRRLASNPHGSLMLDSILAGEGPHPQYYVQLKDKIPQSVIDAEKRCWTEAQQKCQPSQNDRKPIYLVIATLIIIAIGILMRYFLSV